eukprot:CAMPEP_0116116178 /NCGR_PEP_ID=MMETSP0329-20121206/900_1 /TAXON_ID=697910 /ORGANISM="Pseudo-nitzschia arenysensis, Strain B593" /LENGTH=270 /DNA_ID=CAMNT_0003609657 /DNA_START=577 /DNA_END=1389 /DNA_ORIENTATION=+
MVLREENIYKNTTASLRKREISSLEDSASRNKYAKRVLRWNRKGVVNVVSAFSLWDAIERLEVPSESVLWVNGDHPVESEHGVANETVLNNRFDAWRETPNALAIPQETSLIPIAPTIEKQGDKSNNDEYMCSYPLLHEMMMHTNYLCYLNHPVVGSELRSYTNSMIRPIETKTIKENNDYAIHNSWDTTTVAIGMLLFSIGDGYVKSDAESSSAAANLSYDSRNAIPFAAGSDSTLATYTEDISNYFGCPCSIAIPLFFPPNTRHCSSD